MRWGKKSLRDAAESTIARLGKLGGDGGIIAIDRHGNIAMPFNTEGMYRGSIAVDGTMTIEVYK